MAPHPGALFDASLMKVVVADDSDLVLGVVRALFEEIGAEVHTIGSAIGLSGLVCRVRPDVVILDLNMPAIRGDEAVATVRRLCPRAAVVLFSDDARARELAGSLGVRWVSKASPELLVGAALRHAASATWRNVARREG